LVILIDDLDGDEAAALTSLVDDEVSFIAESTLERLINLGLAKWQAGRIVATETGAEIILRPRAMH
jgi:hypothetical protein